MGCIFKCFKVLNNTFCRKFTPCKTIRLRPSAIRNSHNFREQGIYDTTAIAITSTFPYPTRLHPQGKGGPEGYFLCAENTLNVYNTYDNVTIQNPPIIDLNSKYFCIRLWQKETKLIIFDKKITDLIKNEHICFWRHVRIANTKSPFGAKIHWMWSPFQTQPSDAFINEWILINPLRIQRVNDADLGSQK